MRTLQPYNYSLPYFLRATRIVDRLSAGVVGLTITIKGTDRYIAATCSVSGIPVENLCFMRCTASGDNARSTADLYNKYKLL